MAIKAVLFDACDILYHWPHRGAAFAAFLARQGLPAPADADPAAAVLKRRAMLGELSKEAFFAAYLDHLGVSQGARDEGLRVLTEAQADVEFFAGVTETLRALKVQGLGLGIVTNSYESPATKRAWFARINIDDVWDTFVASSKIGVAKPQAGIYLTALEALGVAPGNAAFVGHEAIELEGAGALGMTTIAFNRDDETVTADHVIDRFPRLLDVVGGRT